MDTFSFGEWLKERRKQLRLTQRELATAAYCSVAMIKKMETDERQPSRELAKALADVLHIPAEEHGIFVACARGERPLDHLTGRTIDAEKGAGAPPGLSLPSPATPFVGRTAELADVMALLRRPSCRLLTLLGPGGIGKTRLALEAARSLHADFPAGVTFVNLTTVADAVYLPDAIAHTLRLQLAGPADNQVVRYLRRRQMLLVLDNCEQLIGDGLVWLSQLLTAAPDVRLLATSRERLNLAEEWLFPVPGLAQAAELFVRAAQRIKPDFDGIALEADVVQICRLVENLPLAVELAAGWTPVMSCSEIAAHIQQDLDILASNVRNVPERHRNIQALFDHSWWLLSAEEQEVLMYLSVFRGGWTAAEAITVAGASLGLLRGLVEKSLVRRDQGQHYDLHPLIRQYAEAKLAAAGRENEVRQQHCGTYLALTDRLVPRVYTEPALVFARLEQEHENLRTALGWVVATGQRPMAFRFLSRLWVFWFERGYRDEAIRWFSSVIEQIDGTDDPALCEAIFRYLPFLNLQGRFAEVMPHYRRAIAMANQLEDPWLLAMAAVTRAAATPDPVEAEAAFRQCFELVREVPPSPELSFETGTLHGLFGDFLREHDRYEEAESEYRQSLALTARPSGEHAWLLPVGNLGRLALQKGNVEEAHTRFAACVTQARRENLRMPLADWLLRLGECWLYLGNLAEAARCLQENITLCQEMGNPHSQADALVTLGHVALLRGDLPAAARHMREGFFLYQQIYQQQQAEGFIIGRPLTPGLVDSVWRAVLVELAREATERAAMLFGAAGAWQVQINHTPAPPFQAMIDEARASVRAALPSAVFTAAVERGRERSIEKMLAELPANG